MAACDFSVAHPPLGWPHQSRAAPTAQPARQYPFALDEFQRVATSCVDRGESVLVCAHTSAGKTVCAEHAIAAAIRDGQRAIYSSPIKALSNQKYRDLKEMFGDVGLVTGDTTIDEESSCLVMTTEVLRVMLYRGATTMREVKWVIFDEMHLLGSPDRGWVLEESLILLPHSVRVVLLSATVPNAFEVAEWLAALHGQPINVVHTMHRPVPLRHYVCPLGGGGLHLVQDEQGCFDEAQWQSAVGGLPRIRSRGAASAPIEMPDPHAVSEKNRRRAAEVIRVIGRLGPLGMLPAIVFCFSRKECELIAAQMARHAAATVTAEATAGDGSMMSDSGLRLLSPQEITTVEEVFERAVSLLADEDRSLAQVTSLLPLLRTGVGLHHSGLLPLLREVVELLFTEGMLRVLIATETLAMGLNLPARTVVFASTQKFDGTASRLIQPTEYTQMSGRAGRRGQDSQGYSVLLMSHHLSADQGEEMLSRRFRELNSRFSLRFSTMLKLMRTEGASALTILERTFRTFQLAHERRRRAARRHTVAEQLRILRAEAAAERELHNSADSYLLQRAGLHRLGEQFERRLRSHARPWLQPGRLLYLYEDRGWAVLVSAPGTAGAAACASDQHGSSVGSNAPPLPGSSQLHVLTRTTTRKRPRTMPIGKHAFCDGGIAAEEVTEAAICDDAKREMVVVSVPLSAVRHFAAVRLWMPRDLQEPDARASIALALDASLQGFDGSVPLLDPIEHMDVADPVMLRLVDDIEEAELTLRAHPLHRSSCLQSAYDRCRKTRMLQLELEQLDKAADADPQPRMRSEALCVLGESEVAQEFCAQTADPRIACMRRMLERLEYVNSDDVLLLKGRAACCIEASDELLLVEVIVDGVLNELSTAETVAVLACMLPGQRVAKSSLGTSYSLPLPTAALDRAVAAIKQTKERLKRLAAEFALEPTAGMDERDDLSTELVAAVLAWASGASFEQCWLLSPSTYEGTLVRHLKALDEMLLQLAEAASALGNQPLRERFLDGRAAVHRGIAFANSLYLS